MKRLAVVCAFVAVVSSALLPGAARASAEDVANSIAAQIVSPFCPGVTLENCPSDRAVALHARIQSWAESGWDEERILMKLEELYGPSIRALPPASGSGLWAWLVPGFALAAGAILAVALARRWTSRHDDTGAAIASVPAETKARIDDELDALRSGS